MTYKAASDELGRLGVSLPEIADALGVSYALVRQARLDPANPNYRQPPDGWRDVFVKLARERSTAYARLAAKLGRD